MPSSVLLRFFNALDEIDELPQFQPRIPQTADPQLNAIEEPTRSAPSLPENYPERRHSSDKRAA